MVQMGSIETLACPLVSPTILRPCLPLPVCSNRSFKPGTLFRWMALGSHRSFQDPPVVPRKALLTCHKVWGRLYAPQTTWFGGVQPSSSPASPGSVSKASKAFQRRSEGSSFAPGGPARGTRDNRAADAPKKARETLQTCATRRRNAATTGARCNAPAVTFGLNINLTFSLREAGSGEPLA